MQAPFELGMGLIDMPFDIANIRCENPEAAAHTRIGWFRSVSNIPHALRGPVDGGRDRACHRPRSKGHAAGTDRPAAYRQSRRSVEGSLELWRAARQLSDRYRRGCAASSNWSPRKAAGADPCRKDTGSALPSIAASSATSRPSSRSRSTTRASSRVPRVDTAIDCGTFVNPERIQSQIEGAAIMGLSLAKYGEITLQERQGAAGQFRRLPGGADRRGAAGDQCPHRAGRTPTRRRAASANRACRPLRRR